MQESFTATVVLRRVPWWREECRAAVLLPALLAGVALGAVITLFAVSFTALIFAGPLEGYVGAALRLVLAGGVVALVVGALASSFPGTLVIPQDRTAPILALAAAGIVDVLLPHGGAASPAAVAEAAATVVAMLVTTALLTGLVLTLLGRWRLGNLMRFVPHPVMGGFLAGAGWLLLLGSFTVMTGTRLSWDTLGAVTDDKLLLRWLPGIIFGLVLLLGQRLCRHPATLPGLLLLGTAAFFALLRGHGITLAEAREFGWMLAPLADTGDRLPTPWAAVHVADWGAVALQGGKLASIIFVSTLSVMLNGSAVELLAKREVDVNRELTTAGLASLGAGLLGGLVAFQSMSLTGLALKLKSPRRMVGLSAAALCLLVLLTGPRLAMFVPKPLLGGLLAFLGLTFLAEWVVDAARRLPRGDYLVVLAILAVVAGAGFIAGVVVGLVLAVLQFAVRYSRIQPVRQELSGVEARSNVDRPPAHDRILTHHGGTLLVLQLQGYLFFGTATSILQRVRLRLHTANPAPRLIVLDFAGVSGLDYSAAMSFVKMRQLADDHHARLVFSACAPSLRHALAAGGLALDPAGEHPDLDHALEWCEADLIARYPVSIGVPLPRPGDAAAELLADIFGGDDQLAARFATYLDPVRLVAGAVLIAQDTPADALYFIAEGQVSVRLQQAGKAALRLRTMTRGTVVGELGVLLGERRTASVIADTAVFAYRLHQDALARMTTDEPAVAAAYQQYLLRLLAERLRHSNRVVRRLLH